MWRVKREWGYYITLLDRKHFKVKLLRFNKGNPCSNQYHNFRNELWLFLSGIGILNEQRVQQGDYVLVPEQHAHQYTPWSRTWVLEIQYGETCEEKDIVRI